MATEKLAVKEFRCEGGSRKVAVLSALCGHLPMVEAYRAVKDFNDRNGTALAVIRPGTVDALTRDGHWQFFVDCNYFITDALIAYEAPGKQLGDTVAFAIDGRRLVVPTGNAKGMKDVAIVAFNLSADSFAQEGRDTLVDIPADRLVVLERFPANTGWYHTANPHSLPQGDQVKSLQDQDTMAIRYLWRSSDAFVGPLVRDIRVEGDCPGIIANIDGFHNFSVVVEVVGK